MSEVDTNEQTANADSEPTFNAAVAVTDKFAGQLLRVAMDEIRQLPDLWSQTSESKQSMVIGRLRSGFETAIAINMAQIVAAGLPHVEVGLVSVAAKGDGIKAAVTVPGGKTLHDLVDVIGHKVTLVLVDIARFTEGMERFKAQADQHELNLANRAPESDDAGDAGTPTTDDGLDRTMIWWQNEAGDKTAGPRCEMPGGAVEIDPPAGSESEKQQVAAEAANHRTPEEIAADNAAFANGLAESLGAHVNSQTGAIDGTSEVSRNARRRNRA